MLAARAADTRDVGGHDLAHDRQPARDREREHALPRRSGDLFQRDLHVLGQAGGVERILGHDARTG